jgi:hypothetical protein
MRRPLPLLVALLAAILAGGLLLATFSGDRPARDLPAWEELDDRWGTYLSEREWGTPREAVQGDGWGLNYLDAIRFPYRHGEDGIAGLTDRDGVFHLGWAVWDERQVRVAERLFGWSNPQGEHGEEIVDRRVFGANTPTSSYSSYVLTYPNSGPRYEVVFESARADSRSGLLTATATNGGEGDEPLHIVLKGWFHDDDRHVELIEDGLLLHGPQSVVALLGTEPTSSQVSEEKRALDRSLREEGELTGGGPGHIGALGHRLVISEGAAASVSFAWAEAVETETATARASELLRSADDILDLRRAEADDLFRDDVTEHGDLYRQALMSLLWSQSLYRWDGSSSYDPAWDGRIDARDVLIMPDKWEFPWLATWDSAFHAVSASLIDPQLGGDQLRFILSDRWQQPNGQIPCAEWVMHDECPPVFAWAAWRVHQAGDAELLAEIYPGLQANHDYWWNELSAGTDGLFSCGFCGMDNLPRGGPGSAQADASGWMAFSARYLALIANELGDAEAADRYRADVDRIAEAVNAELWVEERGFYFDQHEPGRPLLTRSYSGLVPLIAAIVPPDRVERLLEALRDERAFLSPFGIRSTAADSVIYRPGYADESNVNSSWRGPVWLPINYLLVHAIAEHDPDLAADLRERLVDMVARDWETSGGRFHEYFDAETGEGLGADAQAGWTALVANLIVEAWPAD